MRCVLGASYVCVFLCAGAYAAISIAFDAFSSNVEKIFSWESLCFGVFKALELLTRPSIHMG